MPGTVTIERVTPRMAEQWLNANKCNRSLRAGVVEKYTVDMRTGKWLKCTAPIVFYDDGELADGQHRLYAIIESGTTQEFIIVRGLDRASGLNIDTGLARTLVDNARISGTDGGLSNQLLSYSSAIELGLVAPKALPNSKRLELVNKHREAASWAISHGPTGRGLRIGPVMAAIGRAWYMEADKDRLQKFCHVLATGFAEGQQDTAAVSLRTYLTSKTTCVGPLWKDTFLKAQNAIYYFCRSRKLTVIKAVGDEMYPLKKARK